MFAHINQKFPDYNFRYLEEDDYHRGLFATLGQLTKAPQPDFEAFRQHMALMKDSSQNHVNIVGVDRNTDRVIAFGSLIICSSTLGLLGKIENIVTCKSVRGKGLGKCIIGLLQAEAFK